MFLELARVVIARQIEIVEPRDDAVVHDPDDVRLLQVLRHAVDRRAILGHRAADRTFAIAFHHFRQIKIDFVTGPVLDQSDAVAIANLAAHRRNAHGRFRASANLRGPFRAMRHLTHQSLQTKSAQAEQHEEPEKLNPQTRT